jgi:hypothetical protein
MIWNDVAQHLRRGRDETVTKLRAPTQLIAGATSHLSAIHPESGTAGASAAYHDDATIYLSRNRFPLFMPCPSSNEHAVDGQASESGADAAGWRTTSAEAPALPDPTRNASADCSHSISQ